MINLPTKILLAIKPMQTQFKFTLRLICTPEYKYTPEYIYTRVFFAHANWTLDARKLHIKYINLSQGNLNRVGELLRNFASLKLWTPCICFVSLTVHSFVNIQKHNTAL